MTPDDYIIAAASTDVDDYRRVEERIGLMDLRILHAQLGIETESGELTDAVKKHLLYGKPLDYVNLIEEAGDLLWYVALLLRALNVTFEEVMDVNIKKLRTRFPQKFTEEAALNRNLDAERKTLEG